MIKDYKFKNIEKYLKKDVENGHEILDIFSSLTDAAIIFSPIIFGPQLLPLLELLDVKDKLFNLGHKVFDFISQKIEPNYLERMEQIEAAYALICYTAYFDSLNELIPRKTIKLLKKYYNDKIVLLDKNANVSNKKNNITTTTDICCEVFYADHITSFPQIEEQLLIVYKRVSNNLTKIIGEAEIFDNDEEGFEKLKTKIESLPQKAIKNYKSQYLKLSDEFSDFALFAQLQNFHGIHKSIENNKTAIDLLVDNTNKIDVGLRELSNIVNSISTNYSLIQVQDIVDDLNTKYHSIIEEPIITDKEIKSDNESLRVSFPKIKDAFIPQSYKCMIYQNKNIHLEDKIEWDELPIRNDLNKFFVEYLYSPDSIDYPLLILGHPGSGKSLLTKVLSAQLMSNSYTVIRIPLREVNRRAFISSVEMSSSLSPSEKAKMLELFTIPENYETYLKTNPDLLTYAILVLINNTDMTKDNTPEYFDSFLSSSINLLSKIGIYLFGFDALTNLIKIAKSLNNRFAIESIKEIIIKQLFRNRNRNDSFLLILYRYPKFISNLLDLLPDFFIENETILYGDFYRWKKIPIENSKKILYFISCYRKITMLFDNRINNEIYDFLKFIKRSIEASDYTIDLNTITYKQIDDLIWFISISINKHQALNVIEKLQDYKKIFNDASTDYHIKITLSQLINK